MVIEDLLEPVPGARLAGEDLTYAAEIDEIQQARRFDDPSLDQGEWVTDIKEADWDLVTARCKMLLRSRSKDLRLAVWLTEAQAMKRGLAGLSEGFALIDGLLARFWNDLYPLPEDGDLDYRLGNLVWLASRSAELLRAVPLTSRSVAAFSELDWERAGQLTQAMRRDPDNADDLARGRTTQEEIDAARRATPPVFYRTLLDELDAFGAALEQLEHRLDVLAGDDAPSFRATRDAYASVRRLAERFAREAGVAEHAAPPAEAIDAAPSVETAPGASGDHHAPSASSNLPSRAADAPATRAQAVAQLREVAAFFRRTEPHSPVAYLADKAAGWADMPLHEWLASVVKEGTSIEQLNELLGIKPSE